MFTSVILLPLQFILHLRELYSDHSDWVNSWINSCVHFDTYGKSVLKCFVYYNYSTTTIILQVAASKFRISLLNNGYGVQVQQCAMSVV